MKLLVVALVLALLPPLVPGRWYQCYKPGTFSSQADIWTRNHSQIYWLSLLGYRCIGRG